MPNPTDPRLAVEWYQGCKDNQEREDRLRLILAARPALEVLLNILDRHAEAADSPRESDYESPSWQYKLAHRNGRLEEIQNITALVTSVFNKRN